MEASLNYKLPIATEHIPPVIVNTISGRYAVMDGRWYEIGPTVTLEFVRNHWKPKPIEKSPTKTFLVKSSNGKDEYIVSVNQSHWSCNCPSWKNPCKHIGIAKAQINE
jgi:hypothetical protein